MGGKGGGEIFKGGVGGWTSDLGVARSQPSLTPAAITGQWRFMFVVFFIHLGGLLFKLERL